MTYKIMLTSMRRRKCFIVISVIFFSLFFFLFYFGFLREIQDEDLISRFKKEFNIQLENDDKSTEKWLSIIKNDEEEEEEAVIFGELDPNEVTVNQDIFFFVSSGAIDLMHREACTVESAAILHPGRKVFLIFIHQNITDVMNSPTLNYFLSYPNIHMRYIKVAKYFINHNLKHWFIYSEFQKLDTMQYFLQSALTYAFLNKFGGTVLSFDLILTKAIGPLGEFLSRCDDDILETYPMTVNRKSLLLENLMDEFENHFDPENINSVGVNLLTQRLKKNCKVQFIKELLFKDCKKSVKILRKTEDFCPIEVEKRWMIFDPHRAKLVLRRMEESQSLGLKLWSEFGEYEHWGSFEERTAFYQLAETHCPYITQSLGKESRF